MVDEYKLKLLARFGPEGAKLENGRALVEHFVATGAFMGLISMRDEPGEWSGADPVILKEGAARIGESVGNILKYWAKEGKPTQIKSIMGNAALSPETRKLAESFMEVAQINQARGWAELKMWDDVRRTMLNSTGPVVLETVFEILARHYAEEGEYWRLGHLLRADLIVLNETTRKMGEELLVEAIKKSGSEESIYGVVSALQAINSMGAGMPGNVRTAVIAWGVERLSELIRKCASGEAGVIDYLGLVELRNADLPEEFTPVKEMAENVFAVSVRTEAARLVELGLHRELLQMIASLPESLRGVPESFLEQAAMNAVDRAFSPGREDFHGAMSVADCRELPEPVRAKVVATVRAKAAEIDAQIRKAGNPLAGDGVMSSRAKAPVSQASGQRGNTARPVLGRRN